LEAESAFANDSAEVAAGSQAVSTQSHSGEKATIRVTRESRDLAAGKRARGLFAAALP
jgi:hypothetical protein